MKKALSVVLALVVLLSFAACGKKETAEGLWKDALYTENTELGKGETTIYVDVEIEDKTVSFTIHTDKNILGDALTSVKLIEGEEGPYGMYIKKVNGVYADFNKTKSYWSLYIGEDYANTGIDKTEIKDGDTFKLKYETE